MRTINVTEAEFRAIRRERFLCQTGRREWDSDRFFTFMRRFGVEPFEEVVLRVSHSDRRRTGGRLA